MTDERAIRVALGDLADDQPTPPPDRLAAVRRRAIRHSRRQAGAAILSAVAVAGIIAGVTRLPGVGSGTGPQATGSSWSRWALPWTDHRNGSVPQSVLDNAVLSWAQAEPSLNLHGNPDRFSATQAARMVARFHVRWYVGQTIAHGQAIAVIFETDTKTTGRTLVVGFATPREVVHGSPVWSGSWSMTWMAAPRATAVPEVSEYVPLPAGQSLTDNWIVVLAPADAEGVNVTSENAGGTTTTGYPASGGLLVADAGHVTGDVMVTIGVPGAPAEDYPVGLAGVGGASRVPTLAAAPTLSPRGAGSLQWLTFAGQGDELSLAGPNVLTATAPTEVLGACYNAAPLTVGSTSTPGGRGPLKVTINHRLVATISCDGSQHEVAVPRGLVTRRTYIGISASDLTSWQIGIAQASR